MFRITIEEIKNHCDSAKDNFLKNSPSKKYKESLLNLKYDVYYNPLLYRFGRAFPRGTKLSNRCGGARGLLKDHAIEISPVVNHCSFAERFNIVSHELAHVLDFELRKFSNHDGHWKSLHQLMGGDGLSHPHVKEFPKTPHRQYIVRNKVNDSVIFVGKIRSMLLANVEHLEVSLNTTPLVR